MEHYGHRPRAAGWPPTLTKDQLVYAAVKDTGEASALHYTGTGRKPHQHGAQSVFSQNSHIPEQCWPDTYQHFWSGADKFHYVIAVMSLETWQWVTCKVCIVNNVSYTHFHNTLLRAGQPRGKSFT